MDLTDDESLATTPMLAKVRKLLAKAEDPATTPAEAEAYTAKAAALMAAYGIDRALLALADPTLDVVGDLVVVLERPYAADKADLLSHGRVGPRVPHRPPHAATPTGSWKLPPAPLRPPLRPPAQPSSASPACWSRRLHAPRADPGAGVRTTRRRSGAAGSPDSPVRRAPASPRRPAAARAGRGPVRPRHRHLERPGASPNRSHAVEAAHDETYRSAGRPRPGACPAPGAATAGRRPARRAGRRAPRRHGRQRLPGR